MKRLLAAYSFLHFLIDLASIFLVLSLLVPQQNTMMGYFYVIVLYNMFAFALQLPLGIIADSVNKNALVAAAGCVLVALAYLFAPYPLVSCMIAGLGNAAFHIGCGIDILQISKGKAAYPGVFIATGAFGVWLAAQLAHRAPSAALIICPLVLLASLVLFLQYRQNKHILMITNKIPKYARPLPLIVVLTICLLVTICLRSYMGTILNYTWKANWILSLIFVLAVVSGKMLGGILGDKIGWIKSAVGSLAIAAILFTMSFKVPAIAITAVFLFNMTMPITLTALSNIFPDKKGFAFGLTTFALFIGFLPTALYDKTVFFSPVYLLTGALLSALAMAIGLRLYQIFTKKRVQTYDS